MTLPDCQECEHYHLCYAEDGERTNRECTKARDEEDGLKELQKQDEEAQMWGTGKIEDLENERG